MVLSLKAICTSMYLKSGLLFYLVQVQVAGSALPWAPMTQRPRGLVPEQQDEALGPTGCVSETLLTGGGLVGGPTVDLRREETRTAGSPTVGGAHFLE